MFRLSLILVFLASVVAAEPVRLTAPPAIVDSGLLKYALPRFSLKTSIKVEIVTDAAEVVLGPEGTPLLRDAERTYAVSLTSERAEAKRFFDWLTSEIGQRTVLAYKIDGSPAFTAPEAVEVVKAVVAPTGDIVLGEKLAIQHCGRCHVVSDKNKFAGIGSSPSFHALRTLPGWRDRFDAFWTLNPHPSFTQVEDITEPFDPSRPPAIAPLLLTIEDVEAIAAFAATVKPADLGANISFQ